MKIIPVSGHVLSEAETTTITQFAELTGVGCFACLADRVLVMLPALAEEHLTDLIDLTRERMAAISSSSDYSRFAMPENRIMVGLPGGICALSPDGCEGDPSSILLMRHMCIDACQEGTIAAIVFNYDAAPAQ